MDKKLKIKLNYNIATILVIIIASIFMIFWISQKEGYNEDEIFSYGSSNYKWDNVYQAADKSDYLNRTIERYIVGENIGKTIEKIQYYLNNKSEFGELAQNIQKQDKPIWKTADDAKEYLTIGQGDVFNYLSVYYNQSRDVHPPLFYMLVHLVSSIAYGVFSKYIIFAINLIFFILTCYTIRKIFIIFNKKWLGLIAILLYGLSMGAASTVIFLRMYSMLTYFCLEYIYLNLCISKNNMELTKKDKWKIFGVVLLGFYTQYYFCVFAALVFILMLIKMLYNKKFKACLSYLIPHVASAILGIILFPASIYHIFFSYRGMGGLEENTNLINDITFYIKRIYECFSINNIWMISIIVLTIIGVIVSVVMKKIKKEKIHNIYQYALIGLTTLIYFIIVSRIAPSMDEKYAVRYVMPILPEIVIIFVLGIYNIFKNNTIAYIVTASAVVILSVNGMITNEPKYLYKGYNNYLDIANKYKNLDLILVEDNAFTYLPNLPELMIYKKSLIINIDYDKLDFLKTDEELQSQNEFVLSIKKWVNVEEALKSIMEHSGFTKYELLLNEEDDTNRAVYLISR